jgi:hypothetical protein
LTSPRSTTHPCFGRSTGGRSPGSRRDLGAGAEIPPLAVGATAAEATNSGVSSQIAGASGIRFGLNDGAAIWFQSSNIGATGLKTSKI